jgi:hypothetical protein
MRLQSACEVCAGVGWLLSESDIVKGVDLYFCCLEFLFSECT